MSQATADVISGDVRSHFDVPDGDQAARVEDTGWYIAGQKLPLFPCLLFDLLHDEVEELEHNCLNGTDYQSPAPD